MNNKHELNEKIRKTLIEADEEGGFGLFYDYEELTDLCWSDFQAFLGATGPEYDVYPYKGRVLVLFIDVCRAAYAKLDDECKRYVWENLGDEACETIGLKKPKPEFVPKILVGTECKMCFLAIGETQDEFLLHNGGFLYKDRRKTGRWSDDKLIPLPANEIRGMYSLVKEWSRRTGTPLDTSQ